MKVPVGLAAEEVELFAEVVAARVDVDVKLEMLLLLLPLLLLLLLLSIMQLFREDDEAADTPPPTTPPTTKAVTRATSIAKPKGLNPHGIRANFRSGSETSGWPGYTGAGP